MDEKQPNKSVVMSFRCTEEEAAYIEAMLEACDPGTSKSDFLKECVLTCLMP